MIAWLLKQSPIAALVQAVILAVALALPTGIARADAITDSASCVEGWAKSLNDTKAIEKAIHFLTDHGQCLGYFGDTEFEAAVGALVAANVGGQDCQNSPALQTAKQYLNGVPGGTIAEELDCACAVATSGVEDLEQILKDVADATKACGGLVGDLVEIGKKVVDALQTAADDINKATEATLDAVENCLEAAAGTKSVADCLQSVGEMGKALLQGLEDAAMGVASAARDAYCATLGEIFGGCDDDNAGPQTPQQWYWFCKAISDVEAEEKAQDPTGLAIGSAGGPLDFLALDVTLCAGEGNGDLECQGVVCAGGTQCGGSQHDRCLPCSTVDHGIAQDNGFCGCEPPYTPNYQASLSGPVLGYCSCDNPAIVGGVLTCVCPQNQELKGGKCVPCSRFETYTTGTAPDYEHKCVACPLGQRADDQHRFCIPACDNAAGEILENSTCKKCGENQIAIHLSPGSSLGSCQDCGSGQKASADHSKCIPACLPGQVMGALVFGKDPASDPSSRQCQACPENTFANYDNPDTSKGQCVPCPAGTYAYEGSLTCTPLDCGTGYQDPANPMNCLRCGPDQAYDSSQGRCVCPAGRIADGLACSCPAGSQFWTGTATICCPANAQFDQKAGACVCPAGEYADKDTFACKCAVGATPDSTGTSCQCPTGQHVVGDKCVKLAIPNRALPNKDCSALGPNFINDPKNAARCIRCSGGSVANAAGTACDAKPGPFQRTAPPVAREKEMQRTLQCPPRTAPNAKGTACIPQLDMPDFGTPGSLAPPGGHGVPGTVPGATPPTHR
jgi:hypothetical protein